MFVCECEKCDRIHSIESRTPSQLLADRRRAAEVEAAQYLRTDAGRAEFSQPCQAKIADRVPYGVRPAVVSAFVECVDALRVAMTTSDADRVVGAWVVVLRLFHPAVLADRNGGGKAGAWRTKRKLDAWDAGCYMECYRRELQHAETKVKKPGKGDGGEECDGVGDHGEAVVAGPTVAAGLAQPAIVGARGVLECESKWRSMGVAAGVW